MQIGPRIAFPREDWSPGFTTIRPCQSAIIGGSGLELFSDFRVVTQVAPDTVPPTTDDLEAYSNANGSYDSIANGTKIVAKLTNPMEIPAGNCAILCPGAFIGLTNTNASVSADFSVTGSAIQNSLRLKNIMRARPVLEDFDPEEATWNLWQLAPPTLGDSVENEAVEVGTLAYPLMFAIVAHAEIGAGGCAQPFIFVGPQTVYGFYIDCKPIGITSLINVTLHSISASFGMNISNDTDFGHTFFCTLNDAVAL